MIDRDKYRSQHAPDSKSLLKSWSEDPPTSDQLESFFLNELCEEVDNYFIALTDVFLGAIRRHPFEEQVRCIFVIVSRLITGLERSRLGEQELSDHYQQAMTGFGRQCHSWLLDDNLRSLDERDRKRFVRDCLALIAAANDDLPMAYLIRECDREMKCSNPDCDCFEEAVLCSECESYLIPIQFHGLVRER